MMFSCTRGLRDVFAGLLVLSLAGGLAGPLAAESSPKKKERPTKKYAAPSPGNARGANPLPTPYVELNADKMPIGTQAWWDQMQREGRLGGEKP
jgi:hypothetical protein